MRYHIIADSATVKGFSIFGVSGTVLELPCGPAIADQAQEAFENALFIENLGVLILSAPVADLIRPQVESHIKTGHFPQILEL